MVHVVGADFFLAQNVVGQSRAVLPAWQLYPTQWQGMYQQASTNPHCAVLCCVTSLCPAVVHSLDLELSDEPLYLLASAHLQLGLLYQRQDKLHAAEQQYRHALKYFPPFVAALSALGQVRIPESPLPRAL